MGLASLLCHSLAPSLTSFEHMNPSFSPTSPVPNTVDKALLVKSLSEDLGEIMGQELVLMHARTCFLEVRKMIATPRCTHPEIVPYWSAYTLMSPYRDYFHCTKQWKGQCVSQQNKTHCRTQNETLVLTVLHLPDVLKLMISHHPHQSSRQDRVPANSRLLTAPLLWAFLLPQDPQRIVPDAIPKEHTAPRVESGPTVPEPRKAGFYSQLRQANLMSTEDSGASLLQSQLLQRGGKSSLTGPKYRALEVFFDSRGTLQLSLK